LLNNHLTFMKCFLIVTTAIILAACPLYGLFNGSLPISLTVSATYGLGFFALYTILESLKTKGEKKRRRMLVAGLFAVVLVYFLLESLFVNYGFL